MLRLIRFAGLQLITPGPTTLSFRDVVHTQHNDVRNGIQSTLHLLSSLVSHNGFLKAHHHTSR